MRGIKNLVVFYYLKASQILPDKMGGLKWRATVLEKEVMVYFSV